MTLHLPRNNLGCLGLSVGRKFYIDVYPMDRFCYWSPLQGGIYCRVGQRCYWWTLRSLITGRVQKRM